MALVGEGVAGRWPVGRIMDGVLGYGWVSCEAGREGCQLVREAWDKVEGLKGSGRGAWEEVCKPSNGQISLPLESNGRELDVRRLKRFPHKLLAKFLAKSQELLVIAQLLERP